MKRSLSLLFVVALSLTIMLTGWFIVTVDASTSEYFTYTVSNGEVTITGVKTFVGIIEIPATIDGYPVTGIGDYAFNSDSSLTSVTIADSVTSIGKFAFSGCAGLTSVHIGEGVTNVGDAAFSGCDKLTDVVIGNGVTNIGICAFDGCYNLTSITFPDSVISIGDYAFRNCTRLANVTIGNGVTSIGSYAFRNCRMLTSITVPDSVTSIGSCAFFACSSLESMTIPFVGGSRKTSLDTNQYPFGYIFGTDSSAGDMQTKQCYYGLSTVSTTEETYYIPGSLKSVTVTGGDILYGAFYNCTGLTKITIGDNVSSIGENAFYNCTGLTSVTIGSGVTNVGKGAFDHCISLTSVAIPYSVTRIEDMAFNYCPSLECVNVGDGVTYIGSYAFNSCENLTSITIPDGITSIGKYAFSGCTKLTDVYITDPNAWCKINFDNDYAHPMYYANYLHILGEDGNEATEVILDDTVTTIPANAFRGCKSLTNIIIPDSVTNIGLGAFSGCSSLESMTIPFVGDSRKTSSDTYQYPFGYIFGMSSYAGISPTRQYYYETSIRSALFYIPGSLRSVTVTGGEILYGAFYNCRYLTNITLGDGVIGIGDCAFYECTDLTSVSMGESTDAEIGAIIGNGVTSIGNSAFAYCTGLTSVTLGDRITSIGKDAFYKCTGLTDITIGTGVTSIGEMAFYYCNSLTNAYITDPSAWCKISFGDHPMRYADYLHIMDAEGNEVTELVLDHTVKAIPDLAFYGCGSLTRITIPNSVTSVGRKAFQNCTGLINITIPDSVTSIDEYAFYCCSSLIRVTIGSGITSIDAGVFSNCESLTNITIPSGITSIGEYAFQECTGLTDITIENGVISIGEGAFRGCTALTDITVPNSVTRIDMGAFSGCSSLESMTLPFAGIEQTNEDTYYWYPFFYIFGMESYPGGVEIERQYSNGFELKDGYFYFPGSLRSVTVTGGDIIYAAFGGCTGLTSVTIGNDVTGMGGSVFANCTDLTSVNIGNSVTQIELSGFANCTSLAGITIPKSVTSVKDSAFYNCNSLTDVFYKGTRTDRDNIVISSVNNEPLLAATWHYECEDAIFADQQCLYSPEQDNFYLPDGSYAKATVVFRNWDGTALSTNTYHYRENVDAPVDPARDADDTYTYAFAGWDKEVVACNGNAVYTATYTATPKLDPNPDPTPDPDPKPDDPTPISNPFVDVKQTDYFYNSVLWAVSRKVTAGITPTTFCPQNACTRAHIVTFLWRALGEPEANNRTNPFTDVPDDAWYTEAVLWAVENGVTAGLSDTTFGPTRPCTRAQAVTFMWRALEKPEAQKPSNPFGDVPSGAWYTDAVLWAVENGVTAGLNATTFGTDRTCTRGQIVCFLQRALDK